MPLVEWLTFVVLWSGIIALPGPSIAYAVAVGSRRGDRAAFAAAFGFAAAVVVYVVLVGVGLVALLAASGTWFEVVRWIGVGYLFYLAFKAWTADAAPLADAPLEATEAGGIASRAALTALTNPKSVLSYALVYPPFMATGGDPMTALVVLSMTSIVLCLAIYIAFGVFGSRLGRIIRTERQARTRNRLVALIFASAGAALAIAKHR